MKAFVCISQLKWWITLCSPALAIWKCVCVGGGGQSVTLCLLSTAALADTGERPSLLPRSELTLPRSPLTHLLLSDRTCTPLQHSSALVNPHWHRCSFPSTWLRLRTAIKFSSIWEYQGMLLLYNHRHTHHTHKRWVWHLTPGNALDPQWQQAGGTATHS